MSGPTRVRLDIAYDGTDFRGWATQAEGRTVQGELEGALARMFRTPVPRLVVAGRTDAGVHARGQVAHLDLDGAQWEHVVRYGRGDAAYPILKKLNGIAGRAGDVRVLAAAPAPHGFDARFSALWRSYEYRIADADALQDPLRRRDTVWHPQALDAEAMDAAARSLAGLHDWTAYCRPRAGSTTIRDLQSFGWRRDRDGVLVAEVRADAFCWSMVRSLVGACVAVGEARPIDPVAIREAGVRTAAFKVVPAKGLTLTGVGYPPDDELAARAAQTRGLRALE